MTSIADFLTSSEWHKADFYNSDDATLRQLVDDGYGFIQKAPPDYLEFEYRGKVSAPEPSPSACRIRTH